MVADVVVGRLLLEPQQDDGHVNHLAWLQGGGVRSDAVSVCKVLVGPERGAKKRAQYIQFWGSGLDFERCNLRGVVLYGDELGGGLCEWSCGQTC